MATQVHEAPPRIGPTFDEQDVEIPNPEPLKQSAKTNWMMKIFPLIMVAMLIGYFWLMMSTGQRMMSPMMIMAPMGMFMGMMGFMAVGGPGGGSAAEANEARRNYYLQLREQRKLAHRHGQQVHDLHTRVYPHPESLLSRCGTEDMWAVERSGPVAPTTPGQADLKGPKPEALRPYLSARIGIGVARTYPAILEQPQDVKENLEPVTAGAYRRFMRTQKFVINCPLGLSLTEPGYALRGDAVEAMGLARAMIASLVFNHSPNSLNIGLISDNPSGKDWDWLKWLPHIQDRTRHDTSGTARFAWRTMAEYANWRSERTTNDDGPEPHMVVFVDTPDADAIIPVGTPTKDTTFVVLRAVSETISAPNTRIKISANRRLSVPGKPEFGYGDTITISQARLIAQKMSRYRPPNWANMTTVAITDNRRKSFFDVAGIDDIETFDPTPIWKANGVDSNFNSPIGFAHDGQKPLQEIVYLNFAEAAVGGTGPHGCVQGKTGSGKSFLLRGIVLMLCVLFGPDKLNLILLDFKGGATFQGFEKLPHVTANISNLDDETELIVRAGEVIDGEIERRMQVIIDEWECTDIVEYRKKRRRNPKMPAVPDLFIFADEFREHMEQHPEDLKWFIRIGTVGRALGMHVIPCSQDIDSGLLRGLMSHLTFGISLKSSDAGHSRTVLKVTDIAKDLPVPGHALIYKDVPDEIRVQSDSSLPQDPRLTRLFGFNVEERYTKPLHTSIGSGKPSNANRIAAKLHLHRFGLANKFAPKTSEGEKETDTSDTTDTPVDDFELPMMYKLLIDRLAEFNDVKAIELWKPTLRAPITFHDIKIEPATSTRLRFRIGDTDAPREHVRLPYVIAPEGGNAHIRILGRAASGRSTAVEAIVASACQSYAPSMCSFLLVEYGHVKLAEIENMPNVNGYAQKGEQDKIDRFLGEVNRILAVRQRMSREREVRNFDAYMQSRAENPIPEDPYGHLFLVIDGFDNYLADDPDGTATPNFLRLCTEGSAFGLHLVITVDNNTRIPAKLQDKFGTNIHLKVEDVNQSIYMAIPTKDKVKAIPESQPGRCVDMDRVLAARILVPQDELIEPTGYKKNNPNNPEFDPQRDYGPGIERFVDRMRNLYDPSQYAPQVHAVAPLIHQDAFWGEYERLVLSRRPANPSGTRRRALDVHIPVGISAEDLSFVELPDSFSPHALCVGDPRSGRTTFLRSAIKAITSQYSPQEAQIAIAETEYRLLDEKTKLAADGYLLSYAQDTNSFKDTVEKIKELISGRIPTGDTEMSTQALRDRSWYSGPEVFLLIDGANAFDPGNYNKGPLDDIIELIDARTDIGLHVYATANTSRFVSMQTATKLYVAMRARNTPYLLLRGPESDGALWPSTGIKFTAGRRDGLATLVDTNDMSTQVVQLTYTPEEHAQ
ncbi:hypothetical protein BKG82_26485 [Mycobacteroides chelonae]|uniref:FtsK domain-containing protein n=1 Tax=Mycobacteroides chelonae TaxID=1774 RepID=A0A1S1LIH1_MYCCH|nr:FtsK/SpoIIIE domain-containing protein [Mycobacteroides chelonae]OHU47206.1 hypothetical protein BKG82_26485 [Mycobacteroides chelonae]